MLLLAQQRNNTFHLSEQNQSYRSLEESTEGESLSSQLILSEGLVPGEIMGIFY